MGRDKKGKKSKTAKGAAKATATAATPKNTQILPNKEAAIFKQILKYYETKQYKKGLKAADQILKNHPMHGETLAMKGLTMNCLKRKEEAHTLVKKGLVMNLKSHVCWHVYGLLYRSDRMYDDAIKCYHNALKAEKDNQQILKDLANLQIQRRMIEGYQETRRKLLLLKRSNRSNWIAYAIGAHLCGSFTKSVNILDSFLKTVDENKIPRYEMSELLIYKNMVLVESGDHQKALDHLVEIKSKVVDRIYLRETQGQLLRKLGKDEAAVDHYRALLAINCENWNYHYGLMASMEISTEDGQIRNLDEARVERLVSLYKELAEQYPKITAIQRIPLDFLHGDAFTKAVTEYAQFRLRKGIPSLFHDLRRLYTDQAKADSIVQMMNGFSSNLRSDLRFDPEADANVESPSVLIWTLYYMGNQFDYLGRYGEAMAAVNEALEHTPTNIDLYMLKARILKHSGDLELAHHYMEEARKMDTADRYLNTKCVRYALRADKQQEAEDVVSLFLRDGDNLISLVDMQCSWYELQVGHSHMRSSELPKALKQYTTIVKHFQDMEEDQFDFHTYCLKKVTLRAYINMIRMEDKIRSHRFFFKAARGAVRAYMELWEKQQVEKAQARVQAEEEDKLSPEEKKKLAKKRKREAAKAAKVAEEKKAAEEKERKEAEKNKDKTTKPRHREEDSDPDGERLAKTETPLEDATKILNDLLFHSPTQIDSHVLAVDLYTRKQKPLLAIRSLNKALSFNAGSPELHVQHVKFMKAVEESKGLTEDPVVKQIVDLERENGVIGKSSLEISGKYLSTYGENSIAHRQAAATSAILTGTDPAQALSFAKDFPLDTASTQECLSVLSLLDDHKQDSAAWKARCLAKFPLTPAFMVSDEARAAHRAAHEIKEPI